MESIPSQLERDLAKESGRKLAELFKGIELNSTMTSKPVDPVKIEIRLDGEHEIVSIPVSVLRLMSYILTQMAQGNMVTVVPNECEMTTRQAAHFLNVSRPYLISLLEKGEIAYRKVGTHRRIQFGDMLAYKEKMNIARIRH
jgi:excisionase family DNA binding protein